MNGTLTGAGQESGEKIVEKYSRPREKRVQFFRNHKML